MDPIILTVFNLVGANPMPLNLRYSNSVRCTVETCLRTGVPPLQIAEQVRVSSDWVYKLRKNLEAFDTVTPCPLSVQGRPRKIHHDAEEGVKEFLDQNPTAYQDEIAEFLDSEYLIQVYRSTVSRLLKKLGHTNKRIERAAEERDDEERAHWRSRLCGWKPNQLVFLDESAANERTKDRKRGWSLKGLPCTVRQSGQRSTRWSILPAIGLNGYLDYEIYHGSFNADRFLLFVRRLLRKMNRAPGPRSVLILDNARIHQAPELKPMCEEISIELAYLPRYSPDYNAIEESFSGLKAWMRRNRELVDSFTPFFEGYMHLAVMQSCNAQKAREYFKSASVEVTEKDVDVDYSEL